MAKSEETLILMESATAVMAEGARVGFTTCTICGACILLDYRSEIDPVKLHTDWHASLKQPTGGKDDR